MLSDKAQAELAILGLMIQDSSLIDLIERRLVDSDFEHRNRLIYQHIRDMRLRGEPTDDMIVVGSSLKRAGLVGTGDITSVDIDDLRSYMKSAMKSYIDYYIDIIVYYRLRLSVRQLGHTLSGCEDIDQSADQMDVLAESIRSRRLTKNEKKPIYSLGESMNDVIAGVQRRQVESVSSQVCYWGFAKVDLFISPIRAGQMAIVGARPSNGKSAMGVQSALHNSEKGRPTLIISQEMEAVDIATRVLASDTGYSFRKIQFDKLSDHEVANLKMESDRYGKYDLDIAGGRLRVDQIARMARTKKQRGGLQYLVVDYVQRLLPPKGCERKDRREQLEESIYQLKELAGELEISLMVLSQINRNGTDMPTLKDLKGTSALEDAADVAVLIHNPPPKDETTRSDCRDCLMIVAKGRNDATAPIAMQFDPVRTRFF